VDHDSLNIGVIHIHMKKIFNQIALIVKSLLWKELFVVPACVPAHGVYYFNNRCGCG